MYCSSHVNIAYSWLLLIKVLCQHISLFSFLLASKSMAQSFTYVNALLWPVMGQCVNNLYAGKPNIHTLHWESYRVILMNFTRGRAEKMLRFGAPIAHFQQKPFDSSFFSAPENVLCTLFWWPGIPLPSVRRDTSLWREICSFSGCTCLLEKPISGHWSQGKLNGTLITLTTSEKHLSLPLEVTSERTRGVCYGWRLKDWAWSDVQEKLIISVHWRAGESSNAVLSSLLPMPRPIKYPCGIRETPMSDLPSAWWDLNSLFPKKCPNKSLKASPRLWNF